MATDRTNALRQREWRRRQRERKAQAMYDALRGKYDSEELAQTVMQHLQAARNAARNAYLEIAGLRARCDGYRQAARTARDEAAGLRAALKRHAPPPPIRGTNSHVPRWVWMAEQSEEYLAEARAELQAYIDERTSVKGGQWERSPVARRYLAARDALDQAVPRVTEARRALRGDG